MTLSTILNQINKKGKVQPVLPPTNPGTENTLASSFRAYKQNAASNSDRPIDPVVAKLKEKRRVEKEKKEQELRLKKGLAPKKTSSAKPTKPAVVTTSAPKRSNHTQPTKTKNASHVPPPSNTPPLGINNDLRKKKLNFNELMKKASKIDHDKLSIKFPTKSKSPEVGPSRRSRTPDKSNTRPPELKKDERRKKPMAAPIPQAPSPLKQTTVKAPLPTRKPSEKIQQKLKDNKSPTKKKRQEYHEEEESSDDELDSFIESDEEDAYNSRDYDRDEIWAMFNRGKKRTYYERYDDYDSDDMEATGAEILDEEQRSRLKGEFEDRRELEQEKKLAALKRARLGSSR
ncbi:hypothetical protein JA1_001329 [Spathaspora sp. JA1]|nr:hypothetical protein JA1_001329 [Spathaspora sp. JA1]